MMWYIVINENIASMPKRPKRDKQYYKAKAMSMGLQVIEGGKYEAIKL